MAERETFFRHSLKVDFDRCEGCTTCMRSCPTGAIRIRGGKAVVDDNKCVDCGQCMKVCPHKAIYIQQDDFALIKNYQYRVCLVPSTFIGQFDEQYRTREIYSCLKKLGFTHIYEVEHEVEYMVGLYQRYMDSHPETRTFISPYCPAVIRLIQVRFPSLVDNVIKVRAPFELASRIIIRRLMDEGAPRESIGVFYVTPCAAKIAAVKYPVSRKETLHYRSVLHDRVQPHMLLTGRQHAALDRKDLRRLDKRRFHISRDFIHRRDEKISEAMARQRAFPSETILEQFFHQGLRIRQRHEAIPKVSRRNDAQFLAKPSRRAAVVRHGHDGRHIARGLLDAAQEHRQAMPAADDGNGRAPAEHPLFINQVHQIAGVLRQEH